MIINYSNIGINFSAFIIFNNKKAHIMRRILLGGYLIICIAVVSAHSQAQQGVQSQYKFKHITIDQGLSHNRVTSVCQDSQGFIWMSTDYGADKFDGITIVPHRHDPNDESTISSNEVNSIYLDSKNNLWFATTEGLDLYNIDQDNFSRFSHKDITWPLGNVHVMDEDKVGKLWIGASSGLYALDLNSSEIIYFSNDEDNAYDFPPGDIYGLLVDKNDNVWISVRDNGLRLYNQSDDTFKSFSNDPEDSTSISDNRIERLYEDSNGNIWAGTMDNGLNQYVPASGSFIRTIPDINNRYSTRVRAIFEDLKGNFFIGTRGGLYIRDNSTNGFTHYAYEGHNFSNLSQNSILCSFIDKAGTLWLGTYSGGVNYTDLLRKEFIHYAAGKDDNHFLNGSNIYAITEDSNGNLWVGGDNGLNFLDRTTYTFKYFINDPDDPNSLSYNDIKKLEWDASGNLWVGTNNGGLNYYNVETGKFKSYMNDPDDPNSLAGNQIYGLLNDIDNNLWIITNAVNGNSYLNIDYLPNGSDKFIHLNEGANYGFDQNEFGDVYIGGENGFWIFTRKDSLFTFYSNDTLYGFINAIKKDSENRLWIGSITGLVRYDPKDESYMRFSEENGYPIGEVFGILEDEEKGLWVSTNFGLLRMSKIVEDIKNFKIRVFDSKDGLQSKQFNYNAYYKCKSGELAFGGINGFNTFFPSKIVDNPVSPDVVLTDLKIFNTSTPIGKKVEGRLILKKSISVTDDIKLGRKQNVFSIEFAALHYADPQKNTFKYKLEGFDKEWQFRKAGNNFATYSNLSAGDYTFIVTAANSDGVWNEEPIQLNIKIVPPFWKTWWFYSLVIIAIVFAVWILFKIREKQVKADKDRLEKELKQGKDEIEKQKEEILQQQVALKQKEEQAALTKWYNEGIVKFSDLLSSNQENTIKLSQAVISSLVSYVEADQGGIFLINDDKLEEDGQLLELVASFAYSKEKLEKKSFLPGEGLIGACFKDCETIRIDNLPAEYSHIASGLGNASPEHLVLVPIKLGDYKIGIIELTSFQKIEDYKVELVEKVAENITSVISIVRGNEQALQAVSIANEQREELLAQEEEIRQNMEEMQATQDELLRKQEDFESETAMLAALLDFLQDRITFKDTEGVYLRVNKTKLNALKLTKLKDAIGLTDADFFGKEHFDKALIDERNLMKSGKAIINNEEQIKFNDGRVQWGSTSRIPFKNARNEMVGTLTITQNITDQKLLSGKLESISTLLKELTSTNSLICYEANHTGLLNQIYGHGLDLLGLKPESLVNSDLFSVFKELKKELDIEKLEELLNLEYTQKSNDKSYKLIHKIIKNASTGGIVGCVEVLDLNH